MRQMIAVVVLLAVGACAQAQGYADTATERTKEANDVAASVLVDALCAMTLGAWARMEDRDKQKAVFEVCAEKEALNFASVAD